MTKPYKTDFQALITTRKGNVGERIAQRLLRRRGWYVYAPAKEEPYPVDIIAYKPGEAIQAIDAKAYPRRARHNDTGIDEKDYRTYQAFTGATGAEVTLMFIDQVEKCVYGARLSSLLPYAKAEGTKVYFPLPCFKVLHWLQPGELAALNQAGPVDTTMYQGTHLYFSDAETTATTKQQPYVSCRT